MRSRNPSEARPTLRFGIANQSANLELFFIIIVFFNNEFLFVKRFYANFIFYIKDESV